MSEITLTEEQIEAAKNAYGELAALGDSDILIARKNFFQLFKNVKGGPPDMPRLAKLNVQEIVAWGAETLAHAGIEVEDAPVPAPKEEKKEKKKEKKETKKADPPAKKKEKKSEPKPKSKPKSKPKATEAVPTIDLDELVNRVSKAVGSAVADAVMTTVGEDMEDLKKAIGDMREAIDEMSKTSNDSVSAEMADLSARFNTFRLGLSNALGAAAMEILGDD